MHISDWSSDVCSSDLLSAMTKFWAVPIAGWAMKRRGNAIDRTVGEATHDEVRAKLSRFVRARWFEPPFGGEAFTNLRLDAFEGRDAGAPGPTPVPAHQPYNPASSATHFTGNKAQRTLN